MGSAMHWSIMMVMTFQITFTMSIPQYMPPPLGRSTTVTHVHFVTNHLVVNPSWMIYTTIFLLEVSGFSSAYAAANQFLRCSIHIPDGSPITIWTNAPHRPFNIFLRWDPVKHTNPIYQFRYGLPRDGYPPLEVCTHCVTACMVTCDDRGGGEFMAS